MPAKPFAIRATAEQLARIDAAAKARGETRSAFVLNAALAHAALPAVTPALREAAKARRSTTKAETVTAAPAGPRRGACPQCGEPTVWSTVASVRRCACGWTGR